MSVLAKKFLIKPNSRWLLFNAPANYPDSLSPLPDNVEITFNAEGAFNGIQLFVTDSVALATDLQIISPLLKDDTILWIIYPKKNSGIKTDLEMMGSWDATTKYGLRPVASAAVNEVWTALRFRPIDQVKVSGGRNEAVKSNEYSAFIDVDNKIVTLPPDVKIALEQQPDAFAWYQQLAYSHKKEYVLWILTAKQEKNRQDRLAKMVAMLVNKKKNPSDK
ncbi:MAG: YdeI/OmpD-associated family protein [Mucilaginibacter sp.]|uniref:YdeI/OmpD-associated family protein n=1 Tax=Mucilaginibacter sp. TaxID=1882438 RepID=UPI0031A176FE